MKRRVFTALLFSGLLGLMLPRICLAQSVKKNIVIRRDWLRGGAYENGVMWLDFPILFGDDEGRLATPEGIYGILGKGKNYHSKKYDAPMPYSLFFTPARNAIHSRGPNFKLPEDFETRRWLRTHGCITAEHHIAEQLFYWADNKTTLEIIGKRV